MAIFLNENSRIIVQGMTGSEGMKHTRRMLLGGSNIVGGVNPRKAGETVDVEGKQLPVFWNSCGCNERDRRKRDRYLRSTCLCKGCNDRGN